ncbi:MAG: molybdopterin-binding protein [Thermomicrobiales bacterium]
MRPFIIEPGSLIDDPEEVVLTEDVKIGDERLRKGRRLQDADLTMLALLEHPVHAIRLEPDDVHEDDAGGRLARAVAGQGVRIDGPAFSRYNLVATHKGLLRVDSEALLSLNLLPGVAIFTLEDRVAVLPGKIVAGVKVSPVAVKEAAIRAAEEIAVVSPVIEVVPFRAMRVGVVSTEGPDWRVRDAFQRSLGRKISWYGGEVIAFREPDQNPEAIARAFTDLADEGADLVLAAGGNTIDPLDPTYLALDQAGADVVRFGAPAHPGSMFWLAYREDLPIFNLASCSMFSKTTIADVVLPWIMTGERVQPETLAALGLGGLLDRGMAHRFPPYGADAVEETGED